MTMITTYLIVLWIFMTVLLNYRRKSAAVFVCWFLVTVVVLWPFIKWASPVARDIYESAPVQALVQEGRTELETELRREFPEFYK